MYDTTDLVILACGWVMVMEGITPLLFPKSWRQALSELSRLDEEILRRIAAVIVSIGLAVIWFVLG